MPSRVGPSKVRFRGMSVQCIRCGKPGEKIAAPPLPTDLGIKIFESVCRSCWKDWLREQTALINHYGLNVLEPQAKRFLTEQTEAFFFGAAPS